MSCFDPNSASSSVSPSLMPSTDAMIAMADADPVSTEKPKSKCDVSQDFANRVIDYYENVANRSKAETVRHFIEEDKSRTRSALYKILLRYERRGSAKYRHRNLKEEDDTEDPQGSSMTRTKLLGMLEELYSHNPSISAQDAAYLLNIPEEIATKLTAELKSKAGEGNVKVEIDDLGLNESLSGCEEFNDDEQVQLFDDSLLPTKESIESEEDQVEKKYVPVPAVGESGASEVDEVVPHTTPEKSKRPRRAKSKRMNPNILAKEEPDEEEEVIREDYVKRCFICLGEGTKVTQTTTNRQTQLKENLKIIFMLKKVMCITPEELTDLMKTAKGRDPSEWIRMCSKCSAKVNEAIGIQKEIQKLEVRMTKCRNKIVGEIKTSSKHKSKNLEGVPLNDALITRKVRRLVCKRRDGTTAPKEKNMLSFGWGDKQAEFLIRKDMKMEGKRTNKEQEVGEAEQQQQPDTNYFDFDDFDFDPDPTATGEDDHLDLTTEDSADFTRGGEDTSSNSKKAKTRQPSSSGQIEISSDLKAGRSLTEHLSKFTSIDELIKASGLMDGIQDNLELGPPSVAPVVNSVICDLCGEDIKNLSLPTHKFKKHGIVMEGFQVYRCTVAGCKYETLYEDTMRVHLKKHDPDRPRPHVCQFCGKGFMTLDKMKEHEDIHRNAESRPYQCEICGSKFAVKNYIYHHRRMKHPDIKFPSTYQRRPKKPKGSRKPAGGSELQATTSSSEDATSAVRKRRSLSLAEKLKIIQLMESGKPHVLIRKELKLSRQTVSSIWSKREQIKEQTTKFNGSMKKLRRREYPTIDEALIAWCKEQKARYFPISGPILRQKAKEIAVEQNIESFKASHGWLDGFKTRHGIVF